MEQVESKPCGGSFISLGPSALSRNLQSVPSDGSHSCAYGTASLRQIHQHASGFRPQVKDLGSSNASGSALTIASLDRYQRYPLGDGKSNNLSDFIQNHPQLFQDPLTGNGLLASRRQSESSILHGSNTSLGSEHLAAQMSSRMEHFSSGIVAFRT